MNESKFEELVNLYFDREISGAELECLKKELAARADRRREFQLRYRLHQATCSALSTETILFPRKSESIGQATGRSRHTSSLMLGLGMAACFLVLLTTSILIMRESANKADTFIARTLNTPSEARSIENQEPDLPLQGSLSSQLRLAGLTPDLAPPNQELSRIDTEALRQRSANLQGMIKQIDRYKLYSAMPEHPLVESFGRSYETSSNSSWTMPASFKSSLASFK